MSPYCILEDWIDSEMLVGQLLTNLTITVSNHCHIRKHLFLRSQRGCSEVKVLLSKLSNRALSSATDIKVEWERWTNSWEVSTDLQVHGMHTPPLTVYNNNNIFILYPCMFLIEFTLHWHTTLTQGTLTVWLAWKC